MNHKLFHVYGVEVSRVRASDILETWNALQADAKEEVTYLVITRYEKTRVHNLII